MPGLGVAYEFSYSFDSEDEDADYDENKAIREYKRQLAARNDVDGIIINTCYLDRLTLGNIRDIEVSSIIDEDSVINFCGIDEKYYHVFEEEDLYGLAFQSTKAIDALKIIRKLKDLNFCAHCDVPNITELIWYIVDGKTVLYINIDTESG
jgi:hypothetical protein